MKDTIYRLLEQYWGYESFLPFQQETIFSILKGQDSLTVLPTGGGKSLCFQLPALLEKGLAVVISPLISLMKDQVDGLNDMGIPAAYLNSSLSVVQQRIVIEDINSSSLRLLYLSPERLQNESTLDLLNKVGVSFFVIDEAHCISHWGHDFRAEYRSLGIIKGMFKSASVHAFTATATKEVQIDILRQLGLDSPVIHTGPVDRTNLTYRVMQRQQIVKQVTEVLDKHNDEPGVIYCLRRKDVDNLSKTLKKLGYDNVPYHAGMTDKQRHENQEKFVSESVNIIVATVAFGMGIDRSNIRFVIHEGMPKSIEHYQQQTGRAGRDGLPAFCYMFYSGSDYQLWSFFAKKSTENKTMMLKLGLMYDFCAQPQCRHKVLVNYFDQRYGKDGCNACDYCLNELDMVEAPLLVGQNIVACIDSLSQQGYGFGAVYIADVLKGNLIDKIIKMRHHELPRFGTMSEESTSFIRYMIEQLIGQGFLQREGEFSCLAVTAKGEQLLDGELAPVLAKPLVQQKKKQVEQQSKAIRQQEWLGVDEGLFQKLRQIRAEIARKKGVPAYIVFGDKTLKDMAAKKPSNIDDFADIYGVGDRKLKIYAKAFIDVINDNQVLQKQSLEDVF
ncbi:MAG: ATP-dependent DNA helicase [Candidatus Omnitrophica bacterium]|nr:ATP-dependent DNA helicase [Candidatus Omnitrophota bacterium]